MATPKPSYTPEQAGEQITRDNLKWGSTEIGSAAGPISFGFRTVAPPSSYNGDPPWTEDVHSTFRPFTVAQQAAARLSLDLWASVANITFTDSGKTNSATIEFSNYRSSTDGAGAFTYYPGKYAADAGPDSICGDSFVNTYYANTASIARGSYDGLLYIHEIGHALGLLHPSDYDVSTGPATYAKDASYREDSNKYTVMSYFAETNTGANFHGYYPQTPMIDDIAAIQRLYGANTTTRDGATTYGFHTANGDVESEFKSIYDFSLNKHPVYCIYDAGGTNTLDCSGYTGAQTISLLSGSFSSIMGLTNNISIADGTLVQIAIGGSGNDTIVSGAGGDRMTGGRGYNTFKGTAGNLAQDTITDFNAAAKLDITDLAYSGGVSASFADPTLIVSNATTSVTLVLDISSLSYGFSFRSDGKTGTLVALSTLKPTLAAGYDTGRSASDRLTSNARPTLVGTATAGATVTLYDDGVQVSTGIATSKGAYTLTPDTVLSDGVHELSVVATDPAGNITLISAPLTITVDTVAPSVPSAPVADTISDTGRSTTDGVTRDTTPTVTGTAEAGSTIILYDGIRKVGGETADQFGRYSVTSAALAAGDHMLSVTATDAAGNVSQLSSATMVMIDTRAPGTPTLAAPSITNVASPPISGTAETGALVKLYNGSTKIAETFATGGTYSFALNLTDGTYRLSVRAEDTAGNVSAASAVRTVVVDTAAPAIPFAPVLAAASDTGQSKTDGITADATPTLTGKTEAYATVTIYDARAGDTVPLGQVKASSTGAYTFTSPVLADGAHTFSVTAKDAAGNVSAASSGTSVTIDTTKPATPAAPSLSASSNSGSLADNVTNDTTPTVSGTAEAGTLVTLYDNGRTRLGSDVADADGNYTITSIALTAGLHKLSVAAADAAGNVGAQSAQLQVTIDAKAPAAPNLALSTASDPDRDGRTADTTPTLTGKTEAYASVTLIDSGTAIGQATADSTGAFAVTPDTELATGPHSLTAKATDAAGNVSTASAARTVVIDSSEPSAMAAHGRSLNAMVQAMAAMMPASSAMLAPSATQAAQEAHPLAAAH